VHPAADVAPDEAAPGRVPQPAEALLVHRAARALGSPLRFTVVDGPTDGAIDRAWAAIRSEFDAVDAALSRHREDSELTELNRTGRLGRPSRRILAALTAAARATRITNGRFDARVLVDLERLGSIGVPQCGQWVFGRPALERAGNGPVRPVGGGPIRRRSGRRGPIEISAPVDFGGIGKGLALRWAAERAAGHIDAGFLLEAGGDVVSRRLFGRNRWSIGIEDPGGAGQPVAVAVLEPGQAIATSSTRIARWQDPSGRTVHHLIDPQTSEPGGAGLVSVTVALSDPAWAEVWSKALFLEGAAGIADVARAHGLAAWWVDERGELSMTPAARQQTSWVRAEAA
jgi:thiamine biosynthesis lipoprotein